MNLLCPNCQKMLTVPEEFAGQLMKCPLCNGTFTVPGLPSSTPPPPSSNPPESDIFSIRQDPIPAPLLPPPPLLPPLEPSLPPSTATTTPPPPKPSLAPEDYQHTLAVSLSPRVLPWIAPVCLVLVFFLQFFDWDGLYPGGVPAVTGNAWTTAFGYYSVDGDLKNHLRFNINEDKYKPGWSALTVFYLLLFFPVLFVTVASVALPMISIKLPPQVQKLLPWRWGIVAALNLILFLFLGLQVLLGFSLESRYRDWVNSETKSETKDPTGEERKSAEAKRGELLDIMRHTFWLRLVVLLHLVAIVSSALMFWINQRGTHRPQPKLELRW